MECFRRYLFRLTAVITFLLIVGLTPNTGRAGDKDVTWSGIFQSGSSNIPPFMFRTVITRDSQGHLIGKTQLGSRCIRDVLKVIDLQVTVNGSNVLLAGSSKDGVSVTVHGTIDPSGTLLNVHYIINGSASGLCELVSGTGKLSKQ